MLVHAVSMENAPSSAARPGRVERLFGRLGLVAAAALLPIGVIAVDVLLTSPVAEVEGPVASTFDLNLVTRDGRDVGGVPSGVALALSPQTFYENQSGQTRGEYRINAHGLRGPELERGPARPRVFVVGGSTAFGMQVADGETTAARLQQRLPQAEVVNAGVIGFLSSQELGLVVFKLLDLEPRVIVALDGWNDLYDPYWWAIFGGGTSHPGANVSFAFMENRLVRYREIERDPWAALGEAMRTITRRSTLLSAAARVLREEPAAPPIPVLGETWTAGIAERYVANLVKLRDVARARDCELLVVVQPEAGQLLSPAQRDRLRDADFLAGDAYWSSFPERYRSFRTAALRSLAERGVPALDGSDALRGAGPGSPLFSDPVHLTARGHDWLAGVLEPRVQRALAGAQE